MKAYIYCMGIIEIIVVYYNVSFINPGIFLFQNRAEITVLPKTVFEESVKSAKKYHRCQIYHRDGKEFADCPVATRFELHSASGSPSDSLRAASRIRP